jgi:hypothetical protein
VLSKYTGYLKCLLVLVAIIALEQAASAQSTIFNIPTTDTVAEGRVYFEFDYLAQMPKFEDLPDGSPVHRLHVFTPRVVIGIGENLEAGANVATLHLGSTNSVFFQPNIKWRFFSNNGGVAAAAGAILYTPVNHREGVDTFPLVYANLSKKVDHAYGPRFTAGPYSLLGTDTAFGVTGPRGGVLAGYEQPIHSRVSIVADWLSGKNSFGYFTPGVSITLPGNGLFNAGYSIGNDSWENDNATHNRLLFLYYGVTF